MTRPGTARPRPPAAHRPPPEFTERTPYGTRTFDPRSRLMDERIVLLGTAVDDAAAGDVIAQLLCLEYTDPDRAVALYVNSPGGSTAAVLAVHDTLRAIHCPVETACIGQAGGATALLIAAGTRGRRLALPGARIALREPALEEPAEGSPGDLAIHAAELLRQRAQLSALLALHTGQEERRIAADLERTLFLTAAEAREYGVVDEVVGRRGAGQAQ
ncbi:ATP-dependent Clp protease proteolytic subunit [Streptomyces yaizuensis]|uniref:ATP-dependent Clp protease proteolytic subunit n=1 Tax=Streptomyces yaizuensis TaxID=2989713 RepID=A0ABQ5NZ78_9ACTN|nr:ATP-dependent Clp protease proteolytic subunit [Streptomyces sp. YSPA8]GLF95665.1 ATP-dependent Clp protease proteolytic subunit [Streptomyces sp. YSPA8]